jgi:Na+-transporting methylmalonyl-CoA/oxaloacetate decarboxylase beta subunit
MVTVTQTRKIKMNEDRESNKENSHLVTRHHNLVRQLLLIPSRSTNLGNVAHANLVLQVLHTLELGLSVDDTLGDGLLAATTLDANAVDDEALLGLIIE